MSLTLKASHMLMSWITFHILPPIALTNNAIKMLTNIKIRSIQITKYYHIHFQNVLFKDIKILISL